MILPILQPPQTHQSQSIFQPMLNALLRFSSFPQKDEVLSLLPCGTQQKQINNAITTSRASLEEGSFRDLILHKGKLRHETCGSALCMFPPDLGLEVYGGISDLL